MPERPDSPWKTQVKRKISPDRVIMGNRAFCKWISRRTGVSERGLYAALRLLSQGLRDSLLEGYAVSVFEIGVFETRLQEPRKYWSRVNKCHFMSEPAVHVHFKKSPTLTRTVRYGSKARLEQLLDAPAVKPIIPKK